MSLKSTLRLFFSAGKGVAAKLPEAVADRDPIDLFGEWFEAATEAGLYLPESMALATSTPDGRPSVRMVLLKGFDARGFVFYTNYGSQKAAELGENPHAALVMHWPVLQRQVRIEGPVTYVTAEESATYFSTRSRGSRIGAWASQQSDVLDDQQTLADLFKKYEKQFKGGDVPLPPNWGGFRVAPVRFEFWQGRANRLHDRLVFVEGADGWETMRLYP